MPKKKLLFLTDNVSFGGSEGVILNLIKSEEINTIYTVRYAYRSSKAFNDDLLTKKINKNVLFPLPLLSNRSLFNRLDSSFGLFWARLFKVPFSILRISGFYQIINAIILYFCFKKIMPDILFINNGGYPGSEICRLAAFISRFSGIHKVIFNVNNLAYDPTSGLDIKYDHFIDRNVTYFVTASKAAGIKLNEARGFSPDKIINIPNTAIDKSASSGPTRKEFEIDKNTLIIGSVGSLSKRKGFSVLINSIGILLKTNKNQNIKLLIFGEGEERNNLIYLIEELKLNGLVEMPGFRYNILDYISDFDLFILPSISHEDMPYVIIEAMMCKKPIIGTNVAGIPEEVIDGTTGFIVMPGNPDELAKKIYELIENRNLRIEYGENGYQRFLTHFAYNIIINKYLALFDMVSNNTSVQDSICKTPAVE